MNSEETSFFDFAGQDMNPDSYRPLFTVMYPRRSCRQRKGAELESRKGEGSTGTMVVHG